MLLPPSQQTRLGKFVNMIRRKIVDESLAKRMKKLIKQWQALLQNAATTPNGLPGGGGGGASSSQASVTPPVKRADPAANRIKVLQKLSNLKAASHVSQAPVEIPNELQHRLPQPLPDSQTVSSLPNSHTPSVLPQPCTPNLAAVNSNMSPSPAPSLSLLVKIPRQSVRLSKGNSLTDMHRSTLTGLAGFGGSQFAMSQTRAEDPAKVLSLIVSIDTSVLPQSAPLPKVGKPIKTETSPEAHALLSKASSHVYPAMKRTEMASDSERTSPMEVDRPSSSSSSSSSSAEGSVPGIHGCIGPDGLWYDWTTAIPGQEPCVTMLPYVYVDGWDAMDQS